MKRIGLLLFCLAAMNVAIAQPLTDTERTYFEAQMKNQAKAWSIGDLDGYMSYYWGSDSLLFVTKGVAKRGWQNIRDGYEKKYPTPDDMGTLEFTDLYFYRLDGKKIFCTGSWKVMRKEDALSGTFTLIWKKVKSRWVIVMDHTE
jgi:ketosteroid isomerase-like protein